MGDCFTKLCPVVGASPSFLAASVCESSRRQQGMYKKRLFSRKKKGRSTGRWLVEGEEDLRKRRRIGMVGKSY